MKVRSNLQKSDFSAVLRKRIPTKGNNAWSPTCIDLGCIAVVFIFFQPSRRSESEAGYAQGHGGKRNKKKMIKR